MKTGCVEESRVCAFEWMEVTEGWEKITLRGTL